jgi:hypothetical protein
MFVWTPSKEVYHNTRHLDERCNTDQLKDRKEATRPPRNKRPCHWCGQRKVNRGAGK